MAEGSGECNGIRSNEPQCVTIDTEALDLAVALAVAVLVLVLLLVVCVVLLSFD
jgi:hypothetical protein